MDVIFLFSFAGRAAGLPDPELHAGLEQRDLPLGAPRLLQAGNDAQLGQAQPQGRVSQRGSGRIKAF